MNLRIENLIKAITNTRPCGRYVHEKANALHLLKLLKACEETDKELEARVIERAEKFLKDYFATLTRSY